MAGGQNTRGPRSVSCLNAMQTHPSMLNRALAQRPRVGPALTSDRFLCPHLRFRRGARKAAFGSHMFHRTDAHANWRWNAVPEHRPTRPMYVGCTWTGARFLGEEEPAREPHVSPRETNITFTPVLCNRIAIASHCLFTAHWSSTTFFSFSWILLPLIISPPPSPHKELSR